ncbi:hypothetical protein EV182_008551 [Spiromyces aspiralis]|uniref:Uncharacterized protein n=1 Tax=Spiromyces aspiralis TaxID=68401 RepID=A0ACC1H8V9_9FUNG|nr:hypothetical protein EV182_008551 [Spiromyces aspiralis]
MSINETTQREPFQVVYTFSPRLPTEITFLMNLLIGPDHPLNFEAVRCDIIHKKQQAYEKHLKCKVEASPFTAEIIPAGMLVLYKNRTPTKTQLHWIGPFVVGVITRNNTYTLLTTQGEIY